MRTALQWLLSLIFIVQMYLAMAIVAILYFPYALLRPQGAAAAAHAYCRWVRRSLALICGLHVEYRGSAPTGQVLIAAKHQSFLDIMMIYAALPRAKFIMKAELRFAPFLGYYAGRMGCVFVNRGKRGAAITKMLADVQSGADKGGQLVIYPQGTRVPPGIEMPYKTGTAILYHQLKQVCVPVATNVGVFWPKRGIMRHPGTCVIEFLDPIPIGMNNAEFMSILETRIEGASNVLMAEAGFVV